MFRFVAGGLVAASAIALSACAGVPDFDIGSPVTVANIIDRIECETYLATKSHPKLRKDRWVGVADLFLQVDDTAGLTPSLTYIQPLATAGTQWTLGVSGTVKRARQRVYNESIKLDLSALNGKTCNKVDTDYDLTGNLGIEETLDIASRSLQKGEDTAAFADKEAVGQTLQFVLTKNIGGGPTWTLTHFVAGGPLAGAERIDTHKLIVSFAPGAVKTITLPDGTKKTFLAPTGGSGAAQQNNQKLLLQSLPTFQFLR